MIDKKNISLFLTTIFFSIFTFVNSAFAVGPFLPNQTLNPGCLPTDPLCYVDLTGFVSSTNTIVNILNATTTNAQNSYASTSYASTTYSSSTVSTNSTSTNLFSNNSSITNATSTNLFTSILNALTAVITNLTTTNSTSTGVFSLAGSLKDVSGATGTAGQILSSTGTSTLWINAPVGGSSGTTTSAQNFYASTTFASTSNASTSNVTNLLTTNSTSTNSTTTNLFASILNALTAVITNLTSTNSTSTNATSTNLFSTLLTAVTASFTNISGTNATLTNATVTDFALLNPLKIIYGGTGLSNIPTYGQVLVGNATSGYQLVSTSTLMNAGNLIVTAGAANVATTGTGKVVGGDLNISIGTGNITSPSNPEITIGGGTNSVLGAGVTITIPDANASTRGLVTTGAQNFTGTKTFVNGLTTSATSSMSNVLNMNSNFIQNLATPINSNDAVNKSYVDAVAVSGVATTSVVSLATGTATTTPSIGNRYLLQAGHSGFSSCSTNNIAQWTGSVWACNTAATGTSLLVNNTGYTYQFNGSTWVQTSGAISVAQLTGKQGGDGSNYFFLGQTDYNNLTSGSAQLAQLLTTGSPSFTGLNVSGTTTLNGIQYTFPATQASNTVLSTNGSGVLSWITALTANLATGNIFVGNGAGQAAAVTMSGDATIVSGGALTLANSGVASGTYSTGVPIFTVDSKGRLISAATTSNITLGNATTTNSSSTNLYALNSSFGNIYSFNATTVNSTTTNFSAENAIINRATVTTLSANTASITYATTTNFFSNLLSALNAFITNLTTTNATSTNSTTTNSFASTGTSTLSTTTITNGNITNLVAGNSTTSNSTSTNLFSTNASFTNASSTNFFASILNALTAYIGRLTSDTIIARYIMATSSLYAFNSYASTTYASTTYVETEYFGTATGSSIGVGSLVVASSSRLIGTTTLGGNIDANSNKIVNLVTPTSNGDATNKSYVDALVQGLAWKDPVIKFATTTIVGPVLGDRYIVGTTTAIGLAPCLINNICEYDGTVFVAEVVATSSTAFVTQLGASYTFNGTAWVSLGASINHNSLTGLQGGQANEEYHLTFGQWDNLTTTTAQLAQLLTGGKPNFAGLTIAGGATITNSTTTNLYAQNASITNATTTNLFAAVFSALSSYFASLGFGSATGTNLLVTNATATNLTATGSLKSFSTNPGLVIQDSDAADGQQFNGGIEFRDATGNGNAGIFNTQGFQTYEAPGNSISGFAHGFYSGLDNGLRTLFTQTGNFIFSDSPSDLVTAALATTSRFQIINAGTSYSLRVDDSSGDNSPFVITNDGAVGVSTTTNIYGGALTQGVTLNNALVLASSTNISTTTLALYNNNGTLYWNGSVVGIGTSATSSGSIGAIQISNGLGGFTSTTSFAYSTSTNIFTLGPALNSIRIFSTTTPNALSINSLFIGQNAGNTNTTNVGDSNIGIGANTLSINTTGFNNVALGISNLTSNRTGSNNVALGINSMFRNSSGGSNVGIGTNALFNSTSSSLNTAVGDNSLQANLTGNANVALGAGTLYYNKSATNTVAVGYSAGMGLSSYSNQGGTYLGHSSGLSAATSSDYNTFIGYQSGYGVTTGSNNLILGSATSTQSIQNLTTGSQNVLIGNNIGFASSTANGQLNIANAIFGTGLTTIGTTVTSGGIAIGTTTNIYGGALTTGLTLNNALVLASSTNISTTTLALYNNAGVLYWNGAALGGATTSAFTLNTNGTITQGSSTATFAVVSTSTLATSTISTLGIGTSTNIYGGALTTGATLNGGLVIASTTPATTTYALYNKAGTLYWNGAVANSFAAVYGSSGFDISTAVYSNASTSFTAAIGFSPQGFTFNNTGTKIYGIGGSPRVINERNLSTAYDITGSTNFASINISANSPIATGVGFNNDGTKVYVSDYAGQVDEYTVPTPYTISTATYSTTLNVSGQTTAATGVFIGNNGTRAYVTDESTKNVYQYNLSTPYSISTGIYTQSFSVSSQVAGALTGIFFTTDGLTMLVTDFGNRKVVKYSLGTAWDISTAVYTSNINPVSSVYSSFQDVAFNPAGTKLYIMTADGGTQLFSLDLSPSSAPTGVAYNQAGANYVGVGTSNLYNTLNVGGGIYLASTTPATTTLSLYNNGGTLYWNGAAVGGGSSSGSLGTIQISNGAGGFTSSTTFAYATSTGILTLGQTNNIIRLFSTTTSASTGSLFLGINAGNTGSTNSGTFNTGIGNAALSSNTSGNANTAVGWQSLTNNNTGAFNTGLGYGTLNNNTTGTGNAAVGVSTLFYNIDGNDNTAFGRAALLYNTSPDNTVAIGGSAARGGPGGPAFYTNTGGTYVGFESGFTAQTGSDYNTLIGYRAGYDVTTGTNNIVLGTQVNTGTGLSSGSNNILIGQDLRSGISSSTSNQLNIGNLVFGSGLSSGATASTGGIGIGTSTNRFGGALTSGLTLNNALVLASSTNISTTSLALYNNNGTLYWNGGSVGGGWLSNGTTSYVTSPTKIAIGTSTATTELDVNGSAQIYYQSALQMATSSVSIGTSTANRSVVVGNILYVATQGSTLNVYEISNPALPTLIGTTTTITALDEIRVVGKYLFGFNVLSSVMTVLDISNPAAPKYLTQSSDVNSFYGDMQVVGKYVYIAGNNHLSVHDISKPYNPSSVYTLNSTGANQTSIAQYGKYLYINSTSPTRTTVVDITNPTLPVIAATPAVASTTSTREIFISGKYLWGSQGSPTNQEVFLYDLSNPLAPTNVPAGTLTGISSLIMDIKGSGDFLYVTQNTGGVRVYNVASPTAPKFLGTINVPASTKITLAGRYAYISSGTNLVVADVGGLNASNITTGSLSANSLYLNGDLTSIGILKGQAIFAGLGGINSEGPLVVTATNTTSFFGGGITLATSSATTTSMTLYNVNGTLFWNGIALATASSTTSFSSTTPIIAGGLSLSNSFGSLITALNGSSTGYTNFSGGIGTGGVDGTGWAQRLTSLGNLINIGSIQAGKLEIKGGFNSTAAVTTAAQSQAARIAYGDLNGDGYQDLVATYYSGSGGFGVFLNNKAGGLTSQVNYGVGTSIGAFGVVLKDLDNDGELDVVTANQNSSNAVVWWNGGNGRLTSSTTISTISSPSGVKSGDLNGDGRADLVIANNSGTSVSVVINSGSRAFATRVNYTVSGNGNDVAIADVNGDGYADIINAGGTVDVLLNAGNGTFGAATNLSVASNPTALEVADVNGDASPDILYTNGNQQLVVRINNGNGSFGAEVTYQNVTQQDIALGDVNGDGRVDVAIANNAANQVALFINNGSGLFTSSSTVAMSGDAYGVELVDMNNDGSRDVVTSNLNSATISVVLNSPNNILTTSSSGVGIGTTTNRFGGALTAGLTLNNALVLASSTAISTTSLALYNNNGTLYWNGNALATGITQNSSTGILLVGTSSISIATTTSSMIVNNGLSVVYNGNNANSLSGNGQYASMKIMGSSTAGLAGNTFVLASGKYAYVTSSTGDSFSVFDIQNPNIPVLLSTLTDSSKLPFAFGPAMAGKYVLVNSSSTQNLIDPNIGGTPKIISTISTTTGNFAQSVVRGNYAYTCGYNDFTVTDLTSPQNISAIGHLDTTTFANCYGFDVGGDYAYVMGANANTVGVINISNPRSPSIVGLVSSTTALGNGGIKISGKYMYVSETLNNKFSVWDLTNPTVPTVVAQISNPTGVGTLAGDIAIYGNYAMVNSNVGYRIIDISDPLSPKVVGGVTTYGVLGFSGRFSISGRYLYNINSSAPNNLLVWDLGGIDTPAISAGAIATNILDVSGISRLSDLFSSSLSVGGNALMQGALSLAGYATSTSNGVGTTTLNAALYIASSTPASTTNALYQQAGTLYWNGSAVAGGSSQWTSGANNLVYYQTGNISIGTSTAYNNSQVTIANKQDTFATASLVAGMDSGGLVGSGATNVGFSTAPGGDSLVIRGNYMYSIANASSTACTATAGNSNGCEFKVFDISNPASPVYLGGGDIGGTTNSGVSSNANYNDIAIYGNYAYITLTTTGTEAICAGPGGSANGVSSCNIQVWNISNPATPTYVMGGDTTGSANAGSSAASQTMYTVEISEDGNYVYTGQEAEGTACSQTAGSAVGCELKVWRSMEQGSLSYFAGYDSETFSKTGTGSQADLHDITRMGTALYMAVQDNDAAACNFTTTAGCDIKIVSAADPSNIIPIGGTTGCGTNCTTNTEANTLEIVGTTLYVGRTANATACSGTDGSRHGCEIQYYNISNPATTTYIGGFDTTGSFHSGTGSASLPYNMHYANGYLYVSKSVDVTACSNTPGSALGCEIMVFGATSTPYYAFGIDASGSVGSGTGGHNVTTAISSGSYLYVTKEGSNTACSSVAGSAAGCEYQIYQIGTNGSTSGYALSVLGRAVGISWESFSDRNLKENILYLGDENLQKILALNPTQYNFKGDSKTRFGFVAQEVQEVMPDLVSTNDGLLSMDYMGLIAPTIKAIQELNNKIFNNSTTTELTIEEITASTTISVDSKLKALGTNADEVNKLLNELASSTSATSTFTTTDIVTVSTTTSTIYVNASGTPCMFDSEACNIATTTISYSYSTTSVSTTTATFTGMLFAKIGTWLADATNGITKLFVGELRAKDKICVGETCLTEDELKDLLKNRTTTSSNTNNSNNNSENTNANQSANANDSQEENMVEQENNPQDAVEENNENSENEVISQENNTIIPEIVEPEPAPVEPIAPISPLE